jgi:hypothetical protein
VRFAKPVRVAMGGRARNLTYNVTGAEEAGRPIPAEPVCGNAMPPV